MIKWKVCILMLLAFFSFQSANASHIIGGEFELLHKEGNIYTIRLILYSDANTEGLKPDEIFFTEKFASVAIYSKEDISIKRFVTLQMVDELSNEEIEFFIPECSDDYSDTFQAVRFVYEQDIFLEPEDYANPEGYFLLYQRCCRNYSINNIVSEDPQQGGVGAGQSFYLEFPSLIKDGERFINSSPNIFPPISDPACVGRTFWTDFGGVDRDGDSLIYEIATPLNTFTEDANPEFYEGQEIPLIIWEEGFGFDNIAAGNPDLHIRKDGMIIFKPSLQGLFVFAVKVSEFRNGEKIGEVRRDYQIMAIDCPPPGNPPSVNVIDKRDNTAYDEDEVLYYQFGEDQKCLELLIDDEDENSRVFFSARPLNFTGDITEILPETTSGTIGANGEPVKFEVCFEACPFLRDEPFKIEVLAYDNTCPRPLIDTVQLTLFIVPPPNTPAEFTNDEPITYQVTQQAGGFLSKSVTATDADDDTLNITVIPQGFDPEDYGISFTTGVNVPGEIESVINWDYDCQKFSYADRTSFPLLLIVDDADQCLFSDPDSINVTLEMIPPENTAPDVNISVNNSDNYHHMEQSANSIINFDVYASDADNDVIIVNGEGVNFNFKNYPISFLPKEGPGEQGVTSNFQWTLPCDFNINEQDSFRIHFYVEDVDECQITNQDTVIVDVEVLQPEQTSPQLNAFPLGNTVLKDEQVEITVGESIELRFVGADPELDNLTLSLTNGEQLTFLDFGTVTGKGQVSSDFIWQPDCSLLAQQDSMLVTANFKLSDDNCYLPGADSVSIDFIIHDTENFEERFRAPNVITPNADNHNDYFVLEDIFNVDGTERSMPEDNCAGQFEKIEIFNRWGKKIYEAAEREFKWQPIDNPAGVYYFYLVYTDKTYKGYINVIF